MDNLRAHIIVKGRVQGVGFRVFVREEADSLGLAGSVQNLRNGDVEVWAEGERKQIIALVERLRTGNGVSRVDDISLEWGPATGRIDEFQIIAVRG